MTKVKHVKVDFIQMVKSLLLYDMNRLGFSSVSLFQIRDIKRKESNETLFSNSTFTKRVDLELCFIAPEGYDTKLEVEMWDHLNNNPPLPKNDTQQWLRNLILRNALPYECSKN